jgi:hypothetical protein
MGNWEKVDEELHHNLCTSPQAIVMKLADKMRERERDLSNA